MRLEWEWKKKIKNTSWLNLPASTNLLEYKHNIYFVNNTTLTQYKESQTKIFHSLSPLKNII